MIDLYSYRIKIISSLPGRFRVHVYNLFRNDELASNVKFVLIRSLGILSVKPNKSTGNILVRYNNNYICQDEIIVILDRCLNIKQKLQTTTELYDTSLCKIIFDTLNPISLFKKKWPKEIYRSQYISSKKVMNISLIISSITLLFTNNIFKFFSILILGYPGILFSIVLISYYYALSRFKYDGIYFKNYHYFYLMSNVDTLLIDNIVFLSDSYRYNKSLFYLNRMDFDKLVILKQLDNPVSQRMKSIIENIRLLGINNIYVIGNPENAIISHIAYYLGIDILEYKFFKNDYNPKNKILEKRAVLCTNGSLKKFSECQWTDIVIFIHNNTAVTMDMLKSDISFECNYMDKLPLIIESSYFCNEINIQAKNIALTLNMIGMLLSIMDYLGPLKAMIFYSFNVLVSILNIKLRLQYHNIEYKP